jgi:phosphatidate phosphatase APP1
MPGGVPACLPVEVYGAPARGAVLLVEPEGVSVISDIDDTLKHTGVGCRRTLLANTFLRPFESIPGMAERFRRWAAAGAVFHYVSASPWQLYEHLARHLAEEGFPPGSFHLRAFRLRDHLLRRLWLVRRSGKWRMLCQLLAMFPRRQFVLVGDSGERDPELYGALARRFPQQVISIWIRQLERLPDLRRYTRAFRGVPEGCWHLFRSAEELHGQPWPARG